jgi:outer membrane protein assembly factor BamB
MASLAAGCQTVSNTYDKIAGRSVRPAEKPAELPELRSTVQGRLLWTAAIGGSDRYVFVPGAGGGFVHAASAAGQVARIDVRSGQAAMRADTQVRLSGGAGGDDRLTLVGTPKGEVLAVDAAGKIAWRAQLSSEVLAAPQIADGIVIARSVDGRIYGLDTQDGKRRWVYQRATTPLALRSHASVAVFRGVVFAGYPGGRLVALGLSNGVLRWEAQVATPRGSTELERIADVSSLPAVDAGGVCAVAAQGRIGCFDLQRGAQIWARDLSSIAGLDQDGRTVYVTDEKNAVHALDRATGASLWKQDRLSARGVSGPVAIGEYAVVGDFQGFVHVLSRRDGSFVARMSTDGSAIKAQPTRAGDGIIVQTANGGLYAFAFN